MKSILFVAVVGTAALFAGSHYFLGIVGAVIIVSTEVITRYTQKIGEHYAATHVVAHETGIRGRFGHVELTRKAIRVVGFILLTLALHAISAVVGLYGIYQFPGLTKAASTAAFCVALGLVITEHALIFRAKKEPAFSIFSVVSY